MSTAERLDIDVRHDHPGARILHEIASPAPRTAWRRIVAADRHALAEQEPAWIDALCADGRYADASRYYRMADGREFVLPLVRGTGPLSSRRFWSFPPAWGIGGVVGPGQDPAVIEMVVDDLRRLPAISVGLRPDPCRAELWAEATDEQTVTVPRRAHVAELSGGWEAVQSRMSKATRKYVRRAERAGVEVVLAHGATLLDSYHLLLDSSIRRWAARQHEPLALARWRAERRDPRHKLEAMAESLDRSFVVAIALVDDRPAYGSIMLVGRTAHVTRSAMDIDRVGATKAGSLVHWRLMQEAVDRGCTRYHLGESGASTSLAQFKEGFGALPVDYAEYRMERVPITRIDAALRTTVKKVIGFRDV